ncbi:DUF3829 domain-containing protein, partial [Escherichia coli]|nr:DUF3829 domain-containing protein [Escherichia coli]
ADRNRSHWSTSKTPSYTKSVSWQHHQKYVRRVRDKVPYSDWDKEQLQDANSSWMVDDSFPRALREYNEMVDDYNSLR